MREIENGIWNSDSAVTSIYTYLWGQEDSQRLVFYFYPSVSLQLCWAHRKGFSKSDFMHILNSAKIWLFVKVGAANFNLNRDEKRTEMLIKKFAYLIAFWRGGTFEWEYLSAIEGIK